VVYAHPVPDSYAGALFHAAVDALKGAGHEVRAIDLYAEGFQASMTADEHRAYLSDDPISDPQVQEHADDILWAEVAVFVYPTWWAGVPAVLKGWLDRVLVNGVAFRKVTKGDGFTVRPNLHQLKAIVGITTYGSPRWFCFLVADAGRRTLLRALWLSASKRTKRIWLGLYTVQDRTPDERSAFLAKVERRLARL
jgi:NAD(P)H dehydrogenase (quinone)